MAYFEWVENLVIDRGPIDDDHHNLVDLLNRLHSSATHVADPRAIGETMAELIFYTQDHLLREEEIMAAVGYPELAEHKQSHVVVLAHLNALQRQFNQGSFTTATDLTELLKEWLGSHIREADGHLRRFLQDGQKTAQ